ncbi:MAG TPA: S8 family serine peptidase [Candidatus Acidoferrales bacterium]|nr:S8 family serine peptidase [Candidatus Acidoferrales bacterium]
MRRTIWALAALSLFVLAPSLSAAPEGPGHRDRSSFLVTFRSDVTAPALAAQELSRAHGFSVRHIYRFALSGMAIEVPAAAELQVLRALRRDPRIATIGRDRTVYLTAQQISKDLNRINGEPALAPNTGSSIQVAIIDTGLDFAHPDLAANIDTALSRNCTGGGGGCAAGGQDDHGHGTSVGGIVAAINNSIDLVGVVPQATLIAVKVFKSDGSADYVDIVAGVDYLTGLNLSGNVIEVANMSFRDNCPTCTDDSTDPIVVAFHDAVRALVNSGTTVVVAAGNDSANASGSIPAAFDEVITVSAMGDSDGIPGGLGPPLCLFWFFSCLAGAEVADDSFARTTLAGFSNFGADVDVIAPGVGVPILQLGGGIVLCNEINLGNCSGTSFASPHAVGVAALFMQNRLDQGLPAPLPGTVRQALIETGECYQAGAGAGGLFHGTAGCPQVWPTDPDGLAEPLVRADNVVNFAAPASRDVAVTSISAPSPVVTGEPQDVTVGVENQGTVAETFDVSLADETEPPAAISPGSHSVSLDPGGSTTVSFTWTPTSAGDHVLTATAGSVSGETDTADNRRSTTVSVQQPTHDVAVTSIGAPASVVQGNTAAISVVVANQGTEDESVSVAVVNTPDGTVSPTDPQPITVPVGQSVTFNFSWNTTGSTLDDHTLTATAALETATDSDPADNSQSTVVSVVEPRHDVAVTSIISQDVVNYPDPLGIQVDVVNEGTFEETFLVTMTDTPPEGGTAGTWATANPQSVTLAPGASTSLIFVWKTNQASAGDHVLTATADTVTGETDTADNSKSKSVNVSIEVVDIAITAVTAPASVTERNVADVSVDVANLGTVEMTVTVSLDDFPPSGGTAGTVSAPQPVTLAGGASTTLVFSWNTTGASAGDHLLSAIFSPVGSDGEPGNNTNFTSSRILLAAPTNLTATAGADISGRGKNKVVNDVWVDLAWADNPGEEGYVIERADVTVTGKGKNKTTTVGPFSPIASVSANTTIYRDDPVARGTTYHYRVKATHSLVGDSAYSNQAQATTQ